MSPLITGGLWWFYQTVSGGDNRSILKLYTGFKLNMRAAFLYGIMWILSMISLRHKPPDSSALFCRQASAGCLHISFFMLFRISAIRQLYCLQFYNCLWQAFFFWDFI